MQEEGAIRHVVDLDAVDLAHGLDDPLDMGRVAGLDGDVAHLGGAVDSDEVDRAEQAAGLADCRREPRERSGPVLETDPDRRAERRRRVGWGCSRGHDPTIDRTRPGCLVADAERPHGFSADVTRPAFEPPSTTFPCRDARYAPRVETASLSGNRLRALLEAGIALTSELSLDTLLQRIVELSAELTGARYAALGVIDRERLAARALPDHRHRS